MDLQSRYLAQSSRLMGGEKNDLSKPVTCRRMSWHVSLLRYLEILDTTILAIGFDHE